jgi:hypothetical protein
LVLHDLDCFLDEAFGVLDPWQQDLDTDFVAAEAVEVLAETNVMAEVELVCE